MDSTPDQPGPDPEEPRDDAAPDPEPVVPPAEGTPPPGSGTPPPPPPGYPPAGQPPANPYAGPPDHATGWPGQPGQWQQPAQPGQWQPDPMGYAPGAWTPPAPARKGLSFGAGLGIGLAIGVVAHILGIVAMFASLNILNGNGGVLTLLWPFLLIAVAAIVMMFFRPTRSYATGILIISAAMWLVIIGPCIVLLGGFS